MFLSSLDLLFSTTPLDGTLQMALDEVLLEEVTQPLLRLYAWKAPCVTFGYFQKYDLVKSLYPDQTLVRRWSGGGCVEHGEDFTFSLMLPETELMTQQQPAFFYRVLHEAIVVALCEHKIEARLATLEDRAMGESCFVAPCPCDVMLDKKKIVGGAQRRSKGRLLYQGSLNLGNKRGLLGNGEGFFSTLAHQLAPQIHFIHEKKAWLERGGQVNCQRYSLETWQQKR